LLTDKYLKEVPADSRAANQNSVFLNSDRVMEYLPKIKALNQIAAARGQSLAQMSLAWVLRDAVVTSALIGASRPQQILDNLAALEATPFNDEELSAIEAVASRDFV
jgi:L-glyceraldehyde 3-phosphate reductase